MILEPGNARGWPARYTGPEVAGGPASGIAGIESESGISLGSRPEDLSKEQFLKISRLLPGIADGRSEIR